MQHTELGAFTSGAGIVTPAGNKLPDAPDLTFNGMVRYEHPVTAGLVGSVQVDAHYSDAVFKEALNMPDLTSTAYWVSNARLAVATPDHKWELALWGKNLFDVRYVVTATDDGLGMGYRIFNAPRTFGVTLSHHFD